MLISKPLELFLAHNKRKYSLYTLLDDDCWIIVGDAHQLQLQDLCGHIGV